ncbi:MAG: ImmA/IrrE family metallo-endopeptidase [Acidobacteria bacterium]|nr:ImmA/IrrE family metallo-endopeptidase [Acidobacteriota bacterium]
MEYRKKRSLGPKLLPAALAILCSLATTFYASNVPQKTGKPQKPASQEKAKLSAQADLVLQQMSRLTGLPIKSPVNKKIVSREEVRKILIHNLHTEYTPQEIHVQQATLRAFGLILPSFDLKSFLVSFYTEQAAGFYDPPTRTMYIADWIPPEMQGMVLAHELTHALQDQNFNLERYMKAAKNNDDAEAARQAVVEGYATAAMFQSMLGGAPLPNMTRFGTVLAPLIRQQMAEFPVFSKAPFFFRLQALFPYIQGASFVGNGLSKLGWKGLNELFTSPPSSTKAIFQPDVYFDHVSLPEVQLPRTTPLSSVPELKLLDENTLGELGFDELLGQFLSEDTATTDSHNWMGDRYIVYEDATRRKYSLVARTRWTSPDAALIFFRDYHAILTKKYPELVSDSRSSAERFMASTPSGNVIMLRTGDEVRWAEGIPSNKVDAMLKWLASL